MTEQINVAAMKRQKEALIENVESWVYGRSPSEGKRRISIHDVLCLADALGFDIAGIEPYGHN